MRNSPLLFSRANEDRICAISKRWRHFHLKYPQQKQPNGARPNILKCLKLKTSITNVVVGLFEESEEFLCLFEAFVFWDQVGEIISI